MLYHPKQPASTQNTNVGSAFRNSSTASLDGLEAFDEVSKSKDNVAEMEMFDKVLVVEDSKFNRKMMTKALSSYAKEVVLALSSIK
jgi:hypothetical protein